MSSCVRTALLLIVYSLSMITCLPFLPQEPRLRPRAKYSVVAVDGSSDNSPATVDSSLSTDIKTVTKIQDQTLTVTASLETSPTTAITFTSTKIIQEKISEQTAPVSGIRKSDNSLAKAKVNIVNVDGQEDPQSPTSSVPSTTTPPSSSITSSSASSKRTSSSVMSSSTSVICDEASNQRSTLVSATSSPSTTSSSTAWSGPSGPNVWHAEPHNAQWKAGNAVYIVDLVSSTFSPRTTSTSSTSSTHSYDNGMWHTTYPAWNVTSTTSSSASSSTPLYRR